MAFGTSKKSIKTDFYLLFLGIFITVIFVIAAFHMAVVRFNKLTNIANEAVLMSGEMFKEQKGIWQFLAGDSKGLEEYKKAHEKMSAVNDEYLLLLLEREKKLYERVNAGSENFAGITLSVMEEFNADFNSIEQDLEHFIKVTNDSIAKTVTIRGLLPIVLVVILIIVIFIFWIGFLKNIIRPILHTREVALQVASGDMNKRVIIEKENEIGDFAAAFNKMVDKLIEDKVKDEALLESMGNGVIAIDKDFVVMTFNRAAEEMLGFEPDEVMGKKYALAIQVEDEEGNVIPPELRPCYKAIKSKQKTLDTTAYFVRKDKTRFPASVSVTPVIIKDEIAGAILVFHDITKEKEIDRAKTEFISLASHQLRSPPTAIKWYIETMLNGDYGVLNEKQTESLKKIFGANERMIKLVDGMLNVSRIELGTFMVEPEQVDVIKIIQMVLDELQPTIQTKDLSVTRKFGSDIPVISADPKLTRIIFENVINNAVRYTPEKGEIEINAEISKGSILVTVSDNGYGIPRDQQAKIFTRMFRADNARELVPDGTGLGLYIVKSILEHVGGKIWFKSDENKGATFFISLPLGGMKKKDGSRQLS